MTPLEQHMVDAETKAWDALSRYKFVMFGYWAGVWVHLNQIDGRKAANPFKSAVVLAREVIFQTAIKAGNTPTCECYLECCADSHSGVWHTHEGEACPVHPNAYMVG